MKRLIIGVITLVLIASTILSLLQPATSHAADARQFNAGRIIDDWVFTNSDSMTVANIQSFLNSKVPVCDTYGVKTSELGGGTRAQWLASRGISTPITCLKDYYENPSNGQNNYGRAIPPGAISAAQIIYNYARQFNINPQVLIVTLQKENGLITDEWPTPKQYSESMGFGCPDNIAPGAPACDPSYGSFSAQIYQAARHFRGYINNSPGWWIPFTTGVNSIQWNPKATCGSGLVNIENRATVALYSYTPYQPNTAAKNAQYGIGDECSAYGNRNFYLYFTDWFGSTYGGDPVSTDLRITSPMTISSSQAKPGEPVIASFTVQNFSSQPVAFDTSVLQCRYHRTINCDSPYLGATSFAAGESKTISYTLNLPTGANYTLKPYFFRGGVWSHFGTQGGGTNSVKFNMPDMRIISPISYTPSSPRAGEPTTVSFTIKNFGSDTINLDTSIVQCRFNGATNCDSNYGGSIPIAPGASLPVSYGFTPPGGGIHAIVPYFSDQGVWYRYNQFESIPTELSLDAPDIRFVGPITSSPQTPIPGQEVEIAYTVQNFGTTPVTYSGDLLQCRYNINAVCDSPLSSSITLQAGEQRSFTHTVSTPSAGEYTLIPYFYKQSYWYRYSTGTAPASALTLSVPKYVADLRMTSDISVEPSNPVPGQTTTITYTVRNFGTLPAIYQDAILQCRRDTFANCDGVYTGALTIDPGSSHTFTETISVPLSGSYSFKPYFMQNGAWYLYQPNNFVPQKTLTVEPYVPDLRLTSPITLDPASPSIGETVTVQYTVKNFGSKPAIYQASVLQCRRNAIVNCDSSYEGNTVIAAGDTLSFSHTISAQANGTYVLIPYFMQNGTWRKYNPGTTPGNQTIFYL